MTADDHVLHPVSPAAARLAVAAEQAAEMLAISRSQFMKLHAIGKVPMPVRLGTRSPRWAVDELRGWLAAGCPDRKEWDRMRTERAG
jgi:predicted DNA-binding transcriptional regulator AlpA